jgi:hypothetical protein
MKTQISKLRSGNKNQVLNPQVNYSELPQATSHVGHGGSNKIDVDWIWKRVSSENPESMKIKMMGVEVELTANWSLSKQSVTYWGSLSKEDLREKFSITPAKKQTPSIAIQYGNIIVVSNGKNSYTHVCPSLIEIL